MLPEIRFQRDTLQWVEIYWTSYGCAFDLGDCSGAPTLRDNGFRGGNFQRLTIQTHLVHTQTFLPAL
jgi:hypothetical protein